MCVCVHQNSNNYKQGAPAQNPTQNCNCNHLLPGVIWLARSLEGDSRVQSSSFLSPSLSLALSQSFSLVLSDNYRASTAVQYRNLLLMLPIAHCLTACGLLRSRVPVEGEVLIYVRCE